MCPLAKKLYAPEIVERTYPGTGGNI